MRGRRFNHSVEWKDMESQCQSPSQLFLSKDGMATWDLSDVNDGCSVIVSVIFSK